MDNQIKMFGRTVRAGVYNPLSSAKYIFDAISDQIQTTDGAIPVIKAIKEALIDDVEIWISVSPKKNKRKADTKHDNP